MSLRSSDLRHEHLSRQLHIGDRVLLAFGDVHRYVDVALVRRDRHLCRVDVEIKITAIEVIGAQRLQITGKPLRANIGRASVYQVSHPGVRQHEKVQKVLLGKRVCPHDIDRANLGNGAFVYRYVDRDSVSLERSHRGLHLRAIAPLRQILALQLQLRLVEHRAIEDPAFGQALLTQDLLERFCAEFLDAREIDLRDGRPLLDDHYENVLVDFEADILEEAGREERLHRLARLVRRHGLADLDGQVVEYRSRLRSLESFETDVFDYERAERLRGDAHCKREQPAAERADYSLAHCSAGKQAVQVVVERKGHHDEQQCQPNALTELHCAL